jgi:hypothetical protein
MSATAFAHEHDSIEWRTDDQAFHQLIRWRQSHGCEHKPAHLDSLGRISRVAGNFGLPYPTANMYDTDITYYGIDVVLDFNAESIDAVVEIGGRALVDDLTFVDLTFHTGFNISSVKVNGQAVSYQQSVDLFTVYPPQALDSSDQFVIEVVYSGVPQYIETPWGTGGGLAYTGYYTSQICQTESEPYGSRNWFPCKDFPHDKVDSVDMMVTHPDAMTTSGNGLLQSISDNGDGTATTHWRTSYPIATYVIHFICAYQSLYEQQWEYAPGQFMPVVVYAFDGYPQAVNNYLTYTVPQLQILSDMFGLYPFVEEKYGNSIYDLWGMENQTMVALVPSIANETIILHEMAHHWWGNLITCRDFHHIWLNEGFATYTEALYYEYLYGEDHYHDYIAGQGCLNAGSVYVEDVDNDNIFSGTISYNKGSRVLHMLRHVVGDSAFFQILRNYQSDPDLRYRDADSYDFRSHAEALHGSSLGWFFNQWLYQAGNPHYEYGWFHYYDSTSQSDKLVVKITQVQEQDPYYYPVFQMPLDLLVMYPSGDSTYVVFNSAKSQAYVLDVPQEPTAVKLDPDNWVLCTIDEISFSMAAVSDPLDTAHLGQSFYKEFHAVGGTKPYSWTRIGGQFPYGLTFDNSGDFPVLSGVPTYSSTFNFTLEITDSSDPQNADTASYQVIVIEESFPGDVNDDGNVDVSDAVYLINYAFAGGPAPDPLDSGDVNCDLNVDVSDAVYIINYAFAGGPPPQNCD